MFRYVLLSCGLILAACGGETTEEPPPVERHEEPVPSQFADSGPKTGPIPESTTQTPGGGGLPGTSEGVEEPAPVETAVLGPYDYEFTDERNGETCTTGLRRFGSLHSMCLYLQDPESNNDCASSARIEKFFNECPQGEYEWYGSMRCEFTLYPFDVKPVNFEPIARKDVLASRNLCVGYHPDGPRSPSLVARTVLVPFVELAIDMTHRTPSQQSETSPGREAKFQVWRESNLLAEDSFGGESIGGVRSYLSDSSYRYDLQCYRTWACTVGM